MVVTCFMNMFMKKTGGFVLVISIGVILCLSCVSCFVIRGRYYDVRQPGEAVNPTSYVYDFSKAEVLSALDSCFRGVTIRDEKPGGEKGGRESRFSGVDFRGSIMERPELLSDVYIRNFCLFMFEEGMEIHTWRLFWASPRSYVYRQKKTDERLSVSFRFEVKVDSLDSRSTRVDIILKSASIYAGDYFGFNPHSMDMKIPRFREVGSTTIEEYEILKIIGLYMGQEGMPPVRYPAALSPNEVREEFKYKDDIYFFPFKEEDMVFGQGGEGK